MKTNETRKQNAADNLVCAINDYINEDTRGGISKILAARWALAFCRGVTNEIKNEETRKNLAVIKSTLPSS